MGGRGATVTPVRVLLVDYQALHRHGVRLILDSAQDMEVVGEAGTSTEAIEQAVALSPDVVLIESGLPDGGGVAAIRTIKQQCPSARILVLSSQGDPETFRKAAAAGAIGYILKDITAENLINALRAAYDNRTILSPTIAQRIIHEFSVNGGRIEGNGGHGVRKPDRTLPPHSIEVLSRVARGLSDKEIAAQLFLSEAAVKTRLRHIYSRLGLRNRAHAAVFAQENGLLGETPGES